MSDHPLSRPALFVLARDALLILILATALAAAFNALRSDPLPWVAREDYAILVPCPETGEDVEGVAADDARLREDGALLVDARTPAQQKDWTVSEAVSIPYDYLEPTPPAAIQNLLHAKARAIYVFGDGDDPDSGEHLARELAGKGVRHVFFITGGAPALKRVREGGEP